MWPFPVVLVPTWPELFAFPTNRVGGQGARIKSAHQLERPVGNAQWKLSWKGPMWGFFSSPIVLVKLGRDVTRPKTPQKVAMEGKSPKISGKSRLVKYYNLARLLSYGRDGHQPENVGVYILTTRIPYDPLVKGGMTI